MTWIEAGPEASFPEGTTTRRLFGRAVGVHRAANGALTARELTCRHQHADLSDAPREGTIVTCPRHGWRYDLATGACLNEPWAALREIPLEVRRGTIWLDVAIGDPAL